MIGTLEHCIKEDFSNNDKSITSTVTTTIFALVAQIERDLISLRTIEALHAKKANGAKLGRAKCSAIFLFEILCNIYGLLCNFM